MACAVDGLTEKLHVEVEDGGVLGDSGNGEAVPVGEGAEFCDGGEELLEELGVVAVLPDGVGEAGEVEGAVEEDCGLQVLVQCLLCCLGCRLVLCDDAGVAGDEGPVAAVVGLLDVDLDLLGEVPALAGVVGEGAGPGDGDEAAVGEVGDLDAAINRDEDSLPVFWVGWVGVPASLNLVGEEGWGSRLLLGCLDPLDDVLQLLVELVEEEVSDLGQGVSIDVCAVGVLYVKVG